MGLTIHYSGSLKKATDLPSLIEDVKDIAEAENWSFSIFEEVFEKNSFDENINMKNLYGIIITPHNSEPFCLSFLSNGRLCGLINFNVIQLENNINEDLAYSVFTKTQYTGFENHKKLIFLLDYVSKRYLIDFECKDEGCFWETRDEELLKNTFEKHTSFIDSFSSAIEMIPKNEAENIEEYLIRLAQITNKK